MENDQRLHRDDLQRRHARPLQPRASLFADSSTYPSHTENHVDDRSGPWSTGYSFAQPELASSIPLEPSMFIGCSWEPSMFGLPASRQMLPHDRTLYPEPNEYYSTPLFPQDDSHFESIFPARRSLMDITVTSSEQSLLERSTDQTVPSKRPQNPDRMFLSPSHFQTPYDLQSSPTSQTQSLKSMISPLTLDYPPENQNPTRLSPKVSHTPSRGQNRDLNDAYTKRVGNDSKPYAHLLFEALRSAKDHRLSLQEIYRWFENNTDKANDPNSKGWQSSIRHNLSMNEAFVLHNESSVRGKSKSNYWTLTEEALRKGVQSTTRYRSSVSKRPLIVEPTTPQQSEPAKKGGNTSRFASRSRRISHHSDVELNEQPHSSQGFGVQQAGVDMQSSYYSSSSMLFPIPTSNTIVPSHLPSERLRGFEGSGDGPCTTPEPSSNQRTVYHIGIA